MHFVGHPVLGLTMVKIYVADISWDTLQLYKVCFSSNVCGAPCIWYASMRLSVWVMSMAICVGYPVCWVCLYKSVRDTLYEVCISCSVLVPCMWCIFMAIYLDYQWSEQIRRDQPLSPTPLSKVKQLPLQYCLAIEIS